jgi:hypothetical protein
VCSLFEEDGRDEAQIAGGGNVGGITVSEGEDDIMVQADIGTLLADDSQLELYMIYGRGVPTTSPPDGRFEKNERMTASAYLSLHPSHSSVLQLIPHVIPALQLHFHVPSIPDLDHSPVRSAHKLVRW